MPPTEEQLSNLELLIGGKAVRGSTATPVTNPATEELLADAPLADLAQINEAVAAARAALPAWSRDQARRSDVCRQMARIVAENQELLARSLALELGQPLKVAAQEVGAAAAFLKYRAARVTRTETLVDDGQQQVLLVRAPVGVVGAIVPWNAPLLIACEKIATAFEAGNTVVLKPSPLAPLTVLLFGRLVRDAVPAGVLNILPGAGSLGAELVAHVDVAMISFTGSTSTGKTIMATAAPTLKRLSLELGGNDAAIVLPDADVARTARSIYGGAFYRGGQVCAAIKRVYVHRRIHDAFVDALRALAEGAVLGDPFDPAVTLGPLSNRMQFDIVDSLARSATAEGGAFVCGGTRRAGKGYFFPPTLVTGLGPAAQLVTKEQFGPILPILAFDDVDGAVTAVNDTPYGLGNSVWTSNIGLGREIAARLDSGSVWINRHGIVAPDIPFGGMKQSGVGRSNGDPGLDAYCELKTLSIALPKTA